MNTHWDSEQYLKFAYERTLPASDLAARIPVQCPDKIADIGCGPGNSTQVLSQRFPDAAILGVDNSEEMISSAKAAHPSLSFEVCDAGKELSKLDHDYSVVFSNACIQWIPDHANLIPNLFGLLKKGGALAVQVPMNFDEPIHRIISEVSGSPKWKEYLPCARIFYTLTPSEYYDLLSGLTDSFSLWETVYFHSMPSHQAILEWYRGTGLRPYLSVLNESKKAAFEKDVLEGIVRDYPKQKNGKIIFRFPRLFFIACR